MIVESEEHRRIEGNLAAIRQYIKRRAVDLRWTGRDCPDAETYLRIRYSSFMVIMWRVGWSALAMGIIRGED